MKAIKFLLLATIVLIISTIFYACDNDNDGMMPIKLSYIEGTTIGLIFPNNNPIGYTIEGGDGNYSVISDNPEIVSPKIIKLADISATDMNLSLEAKGLGTAKVNITDNSQNSLILNVIVDYAINAYEVKLIEIRVTGGDLTENQKNAIIENQLAENPVKVGGGYRFYHTDSPNKKGEVTVFKDTYGHNGVKTEFNIVEYEKPLYTNSYLWGYEFTADEIERTMVLGEYTKSTRNLAPRISALIEDVTEKVQVEYPQAESVIIYQVVVSK